MFISVITMVRKDVEGNKISLEISLGISILSIIELMADAIKCEDVLSEEICAKLKDAAEKLKQKAKVIDQLVREAIAKKVTEAKEIVKRVQQKLIDMAKDFKCEDVLSTKVSTCVSRITLILSLFLFNSHLVLITSDLNFL